MNTYVCIYIYIYIYLYACVCLYIAASNRARILSFFYVSCIPSDVYVCTLLMYIYVCVCVCGLEPAMKFGGICMHPGNEIRGIRMHPGDEIRGIRMHSCVYICTYTDAWSQATGVPCSHSHTHVCAHMHVVICIMISL